MSSPAPADALWRDHDGRPVYRHRPKLIGPEITFTLEERDLAWSDGRSSGRLPLHQIDSLRIAFRPANLHSQRYRVDVRQRLGRSIWFSNVSWQGMVQLEAHDAAFSAFVKALVHAVAKASPKARFRAGEPLWRYGLVALVTAMLSAAFAMLAIESARNLNWPMLGIVALLGGYAAWLMGQWLVKNRPADFDPDHPPEILLPGLTPLPAVAP